MQKLTSQLNKEEQDEFKKVKSDFQTYDESAQTLCLEYYLQYRSAARISHDKIGLAMKCAYFMAEKSHYILTVTGEKIRGISFSLNKLLKNYKLDDTMMLLKDFSKKVTINDQEAASDLFNLIKEISFLITFYSKFQRTIEKLDFKERTNETGNYIKVLTSYAWLLYVKAKNQVLNRSLETISNTCLLAHILCTIIICAWDYMRPLGLIKEEKRLGVESSKKEVKKIVIEKILGIFLIKNMDAYEEVASSFEEFLNEMINKGIITMTSGKADFFSPIKIYHNYQRLDDFYKKSHNPENLDERIFFKQRTVNYTPSKFTPFARQGNNTKIQQRFGGSSNVNKDLQSHRVLNYDLIEKQTQMCENVPIKDIKLPKSIVQSPSMVRVPMVCSTPTTASMEMYNYLTEKSKKIKDLAIQPKHFDKQAISLVERVFEHQRLDQQDSKRNMIMALYKVASWQYGSLHSNEKENDEFLKGFLTLCMELVFYASNSSVSFEDIIKVLGTRALDMWRAVDHVHKSDKRIPTNLKYHLLDLETEIISSKIWEDSTLLRTIVDIANNNTSNMEQSQLFVGDKLFRRVLHHIGFRVKQLSDLLGISEDVSQKIFQTMKQTLLSHDELLHSRHIDQLILCAVFSNCKRAGYDIKFNNIKEVYEDSNPSLKSSIENIIYRVHVSDHEKPLDIIKFYNQYYLRTQELKKYIQSLYDGHHVKNRHKNSLLMSPLKTIIPRDINFKHKPKMHNGKSNVTPQPQLLYAYNESPILKNQLHSFKGKGNLKSKRVLDFDLEQTISKTKPEDPTNTTAKTPSHNQQVSDFLHKKILKKVQHIEHKDGIKTPPNAHTPLNSRHPSQIDLGYQTVDINSFKMKPSFKR